MKQPRTLTAEERRLWRESNRHTQVTQDDCPEDMQGVARGEAPSAAAPAKPTRAALPNTARAKTHTTLAPLKPLTARAGAKFFKPHATVEATLDLHGLGKLDAYAQVHDFIRAMQRAGRRHVSIITGKGREGVAGVLRTNLPNWLNEPRLRPLISGFAAAPQEKGGSGVLHVLLKRTV
jgi:DNA-nicking Smr family endonuclease